MGDLLALLGAPALVALVAALVLLAARADARRARSRGRRHRRGGRHRAPVGLWRRLFTLSSGPPAVGAVVAP